MMISKEDQTTLTSLRWHWDTAYAINFDGSTWTAIPTGDPETILSESSSMKLRHAMQDDLAARVIQSRAAAAKRSETAGKWAGNSSC